VELCAWCKVEEVSGPKRAYCSQRCFGKARADRKRAGAVPPPSVPGGAWLPLTDGRFALVDADLSSELSRYSWSGAGTNGAYAATSIGSKRVYLHHMVLPGQRVDHKNGNTLDCRRDNLRTATQRQNTGNMRSRAKKSPYKGISMLSTGKGWNARIRMPDGSRPSLGCFATPEAAARAYDAMARQVHGEFACVNFPDEHNHMVPMLARPTAAL
jgi:hypothetical protein